MTSLERIFELLWKQLEITSTYASLAPFFLGGVVTLFKLWIPTEDDIRKRLSAQSSTFREKVNNEIHILLSKAVFSIDQGKLRGNSAAQPPEPDLIGVCTTKVFRAVDVLRDLATLQRRSAWAHALIFYTTIIGLLSFLFLLIVESSRPYVGLLGYVLIISQVVFICMLRRYQGELEKYERGA